MAVAHARARPSRADDVLGLHRMVGNRAIADVASGRATAPVAVLQRLATVQRKPASSAASRRADAARAGSGPFDAATAVALQLPALLPVLSEAQLEKIQHVLSAAYVEPEEGETAAQAARHRWTPEFAKLKPEDKRVRVEHAKLLAPDALRAESDNPDEAAFVEELRERLRTEGVWLQIDAWSYPPKLWLTLGPEPTGMHAINSVLGLINREALRPALGGAYWSNVVEGPTLSKLQQAEGEIQSLIDAGMAAHEKQRRVRASFKYSWNPVRNVVPGVSDTLGGAEFPDTHLWLGAQDALGEAVKLRAQGKTTAARSRLAIAAELVQIASKQMADYQEGTVEGAEIAKTWVERAQKANTVLYAFGLTAAIAGAGVGVVAAEADAGATTVVAEGASDTDAIATQYLKEKIREDPRGMKAAFDLGTDSYVPSPGGNTARGIGAKLRESTAEKTGLGQGNWL